jgi:hypothetical protein
MNNNTIPLQEALPWQPIIPRNILVNDSIETPGVFLLHAMVSQFFLTPTSENNSKNTGRVLWLSGTSSTEKQIASSLKRMGCDRGDDYIRGVRSRNNNNNINRSLTIRSVAMEVSDKFLLSSDENPNENDFEDEQYLKQVYKDVKAWVAERQQADIPSNSVSTDTQQSFPMCWIVLDDVSSMATILGEQLVYCFVTSLLSLSCRKANLGIIIRCSSDLDQLAIQMMASEGKDQSGWVGAGGLYYKESRKQNLTQQMMTTWERRLEASVDAVVDVLPLPSGFSQDAHGRLFFSETPTGRGWGKHVFHAGSTSIDASNNLIINYCVQEMGVRAIRLRAPISTQGGKPK